MARVERSKTRPATHTFTAVIEPDEEDGGFLATQGETIEEARWMAEDCLRGFLEVLSDSGRALPRSGAPVPPADSLALQFQVTAA